MQQFLATEISTPSSAAVTPMERGLLGGYRPQPGVYDEMMERTGEMRPHWKIFGQMLAQHATPELRGRHDTIQRLLRDHGVTYNIYDDASGTVRQWALDLMPFIVAANDWNKIAAGLAQRARLLNLVLADIYGAQRLLSEGRLPPSLIFSNPGYLRPVQGIAPPGGNFLMTMGTDLVRDASGAWMALADRTQAPSGKGYTLENRIILSNIFPDEFSASRVQRLAGYFETERESFRALAPSRRGTPSVVLHSPGPYNETYFEQAFKARYLGYPLVEGADLTVRDRRVHLKTLEGLRRVDVIVRRVDDTFCDPLELRSDALLGVPGLVEAWRSGNVSIVNGLGTGVIETPAMHPFLPGLCRHLLGEELLLPSVPTWWCGQKRELQMVLSNPERWVVKPAFARGTREPIFIAETDSRKRAELLEQIRAKPHNWVAQEVLNLSTTPAYVDGALQPRSLVWRTFTNVSGNKCTVMQGGLTRVSPASRGLVVTMQSGGISKDTWVLTDGEVEQTTLLPSQAVVIRPARPPGGVPSRVADHLFWLGRYAERLEQTVRVLRTMLQRLTGEGSELQSRELAACVKLFEALKIDLEATQSFDFNSIRSMARKIVEDPKEEGGIRDLLNRVRFNAAAARDRLSDDTWRLLNRLERDAKLSTKQWFVPDALAMLDSLVLDLAAFSGMQLENMTRGHGWRFLEIGRRLERALGVFTLAGATIASENESVLAPMLEICDSSMTYRRLHFARPVLAPVLDLILLNDMNPRSAAFQLHALGRHVSQLQQSPGATFSASEKELADALQSDLASLNLAALAEPDDESRGFVTDLCARLCVNLEKLSDQLSGHYFSHAVRRER